MQNFEEPMQPKQSCVSEGLASRAKRLMEDPSTKQRKGTGLTGRSRSSRAGGNTRGHKSRGAADHVGVVVIPR